MLFHYALAQSTAQVTAQNFLAKLNDAIIYPLLTLMMAAALIVFLYGAFEYVKNSTSDEGRATGQRHLLWGVVGMLVMLSAFAILTIAANTFGLKGDLDSATGSPFAPVTSPRPGVRPPTVSPTPTPNPPVVSPTPRPVPPVLSPSPSPTSPNPPPVFGS